MHAITLTRPSERISSLALCVAFTSAALVLMLANAAFVGGSIAARVGAARAFARADKAFARAAELESRVAHADAPTALAASRAGFVAPHSFSYTTTRPLGSAASPNDI